jgi:hypothetical protein
MLNVYELHELANRNPQPVKQQTQPPSMDDEDDMARIFVDLDSF